MAEEPLHRWPKISAQRTAAKLAALTAALDVLSPLGNLARGYSVATKTSTGQVLVTAVDAPVGTEVDVRLAAGRLLCDVRRVLVGEND